MPSRRQIEEHVDTLSGRHSGRAFAEAVEGYAAGLAEDEREVLASVLVERAADEGAFHRGYALQQNERSWFRRQLDKLQPR